MEKFFLFFYFNFMHKLLFINMIVGFHLYLRSALFGSIKVVDEQVEARKYVNGVAHNC